MLWEAIEKDLKEANENVTNESAYLQACTELAKALEDTVAPPEHVSENLLSPYRATQCVRKNGYKVLGTIEEPFSARTRITFLMGHLLESSHRFLARNAGVEMAGGNVKVDVPIGDETVEGYIDDIVVGKNSGKRVLVEFKSMSSYGFADFKRRSDKGLPLSDTFGYAGQINVYLRGAKLAGLLDVTDTGQGPFGVIYGIAKDTGHVHEHMVRFDESIANVADQNWHDVKLTKEDGILPARLIHDEVGGRVPVELNKGGALPVVCSYCPFKYSCWEGRDPIKFEGDEHGSFNPVFDSEPTTGHVLKKSFSKGRGGNFQPVFKLREV